jgi:hypothetical protein
MVEPKYSVVVRQPDTFSWQWEIFRDGQALPIRLRGGPHRSKNSADRAGKAALREFLSALDREQNA